MNDKITIGDKEISKIALHLLKNFTNEDKHLLDAIVTSIKTKDMKPVMDNSLRLKNDALEFLRFKHEFDLLDKGGNPLKKVLGIPCTREEYHSHLNDLFRKGKITKEQRSKLHGISSINWSKSYNEFLTLGIV